MSTMYDELKKRGTATGNHPCKSCPKTHFWPYELWCRAERMRLHPLNFKRWTEDEHKAKKRGLTWEQQTTVWAHMDAWERCFDEEWTVEQTRAAVALLSPVPSVQSIKAVAMQMQMQVWAKKEQKYAEAAIIDRDEEEYAMSLIRPVPLPKRTVDAPW